MRQIQLAGAVIRPTSQLDIWLQLIQAREYLAALTGRELGECIGSGLGNHQAYKRLIEQSNSQAVNTISRWSRQSGVVPGQSVDMSDKGLI